MRAMRKSKKKRLESRGWEVGTAAQFLSLSPDETAYIELKVALSTRLKRQRAIKKMTQHQLARLLGSSQSRVAKMEAGDPSVSLDLLVRSLLALGSTTKDLARTITL
jgi:DNA-binding XRE family transcriptional regulator